MSNVSRRFVLILLRFAINIKANSYFAEVIYDIGLTSLSKLNTCELNHFKPAIIGCQAHHGVLCRHVEL
jgi:hypothetical protein